ncbi:hypothetical protein [uncultured Tenacibaculum sp.]|uniref:hypothetical protein n=1 Tax=uncultured Tenacibaculum sp. TaxID=174713 RepID=UPI002634B3F4|nr:hypothetical protein [uncultured Tenacibaculum sp.]
MKKIVFTLAMFSIAMTGYAQTVVEKTPEGNVGIGTNTPKNKNESTGVATVLHVKKTDVSGDVEVARFEGGNDSNNTAAIVRINHANDRGLYLKGGRRNSDRSFGEIGVIGTLGDLETPSIILDDQGVMSVGGDVSPAGGLSPDKSRKLYVNGGLTINRGNILSFDKDYYVHAYSQYDNSVPETRYLNYGYYGHRWETRKGVGMVILGNNNNIGVGITSPSEKLEVYNSITTPGVISLRSSRNDAGYVDVGRVVAKQGTTEVSRIGMPRAGGTYTGFLTFWTKETNSSPLKESMRINEKGNVGIGTTTTGNHRLAVEGSIGAREIKVEAYPNWSDFVFEKEYKLPTLTQVENHIKEKGHLKDIPSAAEVKKDGFFLGEMDAKLLQKIEELTLYTIEQEKKINKTENINKKLLSVIEKLEKRITKLEEKE